jgi:RNA polymerase sigma-70 factor, ECF subfamily
MSNLTTSAGTRPLARARVTALPGKSDEELLLAYCDRKEAESFDELVHRYEKELYSYLRRYLGDAALAEDAFQGTFLQVHLKCGQFERGRKFRPWLYAIATHQAIDVQRRNKRHRGVSLDQQRAGADRDDVGSLLSMLQSHEQSPPANLEACERREWIRQTLEQLPEPLRIVVVLVYYQGVKYREAADVLKIPVGTVKSRLHAAILKLNEQWIGAGRSHDD